MKATEIPAWDRCDTVVGLNEDSYRADKHGHIIRKKSFGTRGQYAWKIDKNGEAYAVVKTKDRKFKDNVKPCCCFRDDCSIL